MAIDRAAVVAKADTFVRQGKLDQAIDEYRRLLDEQPGDVSAANTLGDLYARSGELEKAVDQFVRLADAERAQGFTPKAVALYKKALKVDPSAERVLEALADIVAGQELFADATLYLNRLVQAQRARQDGAAVAQTLSRLAVLPSASIETRLEAAHAVDTVAGGDRSAPLFALAAEALDAAARTPEALDAWLAAASRSTDVSIRRAATAACFRAGALHRADSLLTIEVAANDPDLLWAVIERAVRADDEPTARAAGRSYVAARPDGAEQVAQLLGRWTAAEVPDATDAWPGVDMDSVFTGQAADASTTAIDAMGALTRFGEPEPDYVPLPPFDVEAPAAPSAAGLAGAPLGDVTLSASELGPAALAATEDADEVALDFDTFVATPAVEMPANDARAVAPEETATVPPAHPAPAAAPPPPPPVVKAPVEPSPVAPSVATAPVQKPPAPRAPVSRQLATKPPVSASVAAKRRVVSTPPPTDDVGPEPGPMSGDALIAQLEVAAKSPAVRFQAAARLGRLYRARAEWTTAVHWLDLAAEEQTAVRDQRLSVLYDLADALERAGDAGRALAVWSDLELEAGSHRDVASRLARLTRHEAAAHR